MSGTGTDRVRAAEVIGALSLATDLGIGLPLEHGLHSTVVAMRLCDRLGVDRQTASTTYYGCLLFYVGCTTDAEITAELFDQGGLPEHFIPVIFGTPLQTIAGIMRALGGTGSLPARAFRIMTRLPRAVPGHQRHLRAMCEVAQMLSERLSVPPAVRDLFLALTERWDGKGEPARLRGDAVPLPIRIVHVARDAALQQLLGGTEYAVRTVRERSGRAFDPRIAGLLADEADRILALDGPAWDATLDAEPGRHLTLAEAEIDEALAAMGDFADLVSPYLSGHAAGVADLAAAAAKAHGYPEPEIVAVRRAALVHDLGRVAVSAGVWQKAATLTPDEWEQVRLHPYHTERVLGRSPFLAPLAGIAGCHHERLDGEGYHRGATAATLTPPARLVAAADAYHAMIEPRPHRAALPPVRAAEALRDEARAGRLDADCVAAVLDVAGHPAPRVARPAGLTDREAEVVALLARGLQTKQIARRLGVSAKTADRHVQNAYRKIGVSTRAAATLFAMRHGLVGWGEFPIVRDGSRS